MITPERIMAWAIPIFFTLIALELLVTKWQGRKVYYAQDAVNSLGLGLISQIVGVFAKVLTIGIYAWCVQHIGLLHLSTSNPWVWISGLLLYDLLYYWLHRGGHEVNVLWAAHVVHHQSENYNLSTALRQTGTGVLLGWLFYLPMALLGYPVEVFVLVALIDLLYQFWVHTELIGRLGWFDRVFCSPANHRLHHAVNDRYLDRNYGGIFILWDRMFGTFVEEDDTDPPVYGTRSPLRSWNPLWANVEVYWDIAKDAWHAQRWRDKLLVWIKPPGWRPVDVEMRFPKQKFDMGHARFNVPLSGALTTYCLLQFMLLLVFGMHFLAIASSISMTVGLFYAAYLVFALCLLGALMEGRRSVLWLEILRTSLTAIVPLLCGRWFGFEYLDVRIGIVMLVVFGLSALTLLWQSYSQDELSQHWNDVI